jgi:hypothetical protein
MAGRIGGDSGLTARGEEYARLLPDVLESRLPAVSNHYNTVINMLLSKKLYAEVQCEKLR